MTGPKGQPYVENAYGWPKGPAIIPCNSYLGQRPSLLPIFPLPLLYIFWTYRFKLNISKFILVWKASFYTSFQRKDINLIFLIHFGLKNKILAFFSRFNPKWMLKYAFENTYFHDFSKKKAFVLYLTSLHVK